MGFLINRIIPRINKALALFTALVLFWLPANTLLAQEVEEYAVKAAFTFNFIRFTQWPDTAFKTDTDPFQLCFTGNSRVAREFNTLDEKSTGTRAIRVRELTSPDPCQECNAVFISQDTDPSLSKEILLKTKGLPVLTIGETKGFTTQGGVINFFSKQDRLQFEIYAQASKNQGLTLSSRLLNLAVIVEGKE